MPVYSDEDIENMYVKTTTGCYLSLCAKNGGKDSGRHQFYKNQLSEFTDGFRCAEEIIKPPKEER